MNNKEKIPEFLSLGVGVQSSTLALMAYKGVIDKPKAAIFADTHAEPKAVYKYLEYIKSIVDFPIIVESFGDLDKDSRQIIKSKKTGKEYMNMKIPMFSTGKGMLSRQCTRDYKVFVVRRTIRGLLGKSIKTSKLQAIQMIGISTDEATRMRDSDIKWLKNSYPLIDMDMSREDCYQWIKDNDFKVPPKSSCYFCPYKSDSQWKLLKEFEPESFQKAIEFEKKIQENRRKTNNSKIQLYLHQSRQNLDEVEFSENDSDYFDNECEGMCGL